MNEPQRLQYLEAMGLTAWVGRYRLPNAAPTEACDWEEPAAATAKAPAARLQALIDDVAVPARPAPAAGASAQADQPTAEPLPGQEEVKGVGRARALLTGEAPAKASLQDKQGSGSEAPSSAQPSQEARPQQGLSDQASADASAASAGQTASSAPAEALRFSLQLAALEGRWLLLLPAETPPNEMHRRLLANLLRAAGIRPSEMPTFQHFRWPMMDELPVSAPLDEARDGLRAFLDGRRRQGWRPERLLVFGEDATLSRVLALEGGDCTLLELPAWQLPSLEALATDAEAKRDLWPLLRQWAEAWHRESVQEGAQRQDSMGNIEHELGQGDAQTRRPDEQGSGAP